MTKNKTSSETNLYNCVHGLSTTRFDEVFIWVTHNIMSFICHITSIHSLITMDAYTNLHVLINPTRGLGNFFIHFCISFYCIFSWFYHIYINSYILFSPQKHQLKLWIPKTPQTISCSISFSSQLKCTCMKIIMTQQIFSLISIDLDLPNQNL